MQELTERRKVVTLGGEFVEILHSVIEVIGSFTFLVFGG
jgi:hypothetical protein